MFFSRSSASSPPKNRLCTSEVALPQDQEIALKRTPLCQMWGPYFCGDSPLYKPYNIGHMAIGMCFFWFFLEVRVPEYLHQACFSLMRWQGQLPTSSHWQVNCYIMCSNLLENLGSHHDPIKQMHESLGKTSVIRMWSKTSNSRKTQQLKPTNESGTHPVKHPDAIFFREWRAEKKQRSPDETRLRLHLALHLSLMFYMHVDVL